MIVVKLLLLLLLAGLALLIWQLWLLTHSKNRRSDEPPVEPVIVHHEGETTIKVTTYWNLEHDAAVLVYDFRHGHSAPWDPINRVVSMLWNQNISPAFFYAWWNYESEQQGVLVTGTLDLSRDEVSAICREIVDTGKRVPQFDEWKVRVDELHA